MQTVAGQPEETPYTREGLGAVSGAAQHQYANYQTLAATGAVIGDAAKISVVSGGYVKVSGADATKGVILPDPQPGYVVHLKNNNSAVLKVWPRQGGVINGLPSSTPLGMAALTSASFYCDGAFWMTIPLVPS